MSPDRDPKPVDLLLGVDVDRDRRGRLVFAFDLTSPSGRGEIHRIRAWSEPIGRDRESLRDWMYGDIRDLLRGSYTESQQWTLDRIRSKTKVIGQNLFLRIFPSELRTVLNELATSAELSLLVESEETEVPWEVLHTTGARSDFLCMAFSLARWPNQRNTPRSSFRVRHMLGIEAGRIHDPEVIGHRPRDLPETVRELELLDVLTDGGVGPTLEKIGDADIGRVTRGLEAGGFDLLHFAGHSDLPTGRADAAVLHLNGGYLEARDLVGPTVDALQQARPFVFLNSCLSGVVDRAITGLGGWPYRFVQICGCGAFLGPQWSIKSSAALRFATSFYRHLGRGEPMTVGEAIRRARREPRPDRPRAADPDDLGIGDPRLLAYCYFGHPNATMKFGPASRDSSAKVAETRATSTVTLGQPNPLEEAHAPDPERHCNGPMPRDERGDFGPERKKRWVASSESQGAADSPGRRRAESSTTHIHASQGGIVAETIRVGRDLHIRTSGDRSPAPDAEHWRAKGIEYLDRENYELAAKAFRQATEAGETYGRDDYLLALAELAGRRPRLLKRPEMTKIERNLRRAMSLERAPHYVLFLAILGYEYYVLNGIREPEPGYESLMAEIGARVPDSQELELLLGHLQVSSSNPAHALAMELLGESRAHG